MERSNRVRWVAMLVAAAALGACGGGADQARARHAAHGEAKGGAAHKVDADAAAAAAAAAAAEADLVSAVSAADSSGPVGLKFRLDRPPRVGEPLRLQLALAPAPGSAIRSILVSLQPGDGLAVESERSFEFQAPDAGATQRMQVQLRPGQPGLLNLAVTVLINGGEGSTTRSFTIPLIAAPAAGQSPST